MDTKRTGRDVNDLAGLLRWLGGLIGMGTFGLCLAAALAAGTDPLVAILRSAVSTVCLLAVFAILCRVVIPLFGAAQPAEPVEAAEPARIDSGVGR